MKFKHILTTFLILVLFNTSAIASPIGEYSSYNPHEWFGYYIGADDEFIELINNNSAQNPSYVQLLNFLQSDISDSILYNDTTYNCADVAERVHNEAEKAGINAAWVAVDYEEEWRDGHACNAFNTIEKGIVYIDCTPPWFIEPVDGNWDTIVNATVGEKYQRVYLFTHEEGDAGVSYGTVKEIHTYW